MKTEHKTPLSQLSSMLEGFLLLYNIIMDIEQICQVVYKNEWSVGVNREGIYSIPECDFKTGLKHFIDTGHDVFREYDFLM